MKEEEKGGNANVILVSENLSPGVYKGPLQYRVWKEMLSVVNPGLSPVTLDPNTAHPNLLISKDLTNVEYRCFRENIPVISDSSDLCFVMGSESFTSGRHYWEVEVEVELELNYLMTWTVGVTKKCSHGELLHIKNPGDGYWVLTLCNPDAYLSLDLTKKFFIHGVKPQKVGVYLDYEEGQVSFYNADNMSHLYTFTDTFTERLYPFFQLYAEFSTFATTSLTLFHLKV
ncbi:zinc-binding protein A33-like [Protopterus annectens]|uniref:zinc-binding protein A33-like n=1 Tax=Protopterus annectens TaxID=7888 RepID=UPI001CFC13C3|nr:zinc-binding protein A33-like [Protopterus annectens]